MKERTYPIWSKLMLVLALSVLHFAFMSPRTSNIVHRTPNIVHRTSNTVHRTSNIVHSSVPQRKVNLNGIWQGKASVDFGFGYRSEFEYELLLTQKGKQVVGYSTTVLILRGKRYIAKAEVVGEVNGKFLKCHETHNVYEDKMPNSGWVPFSKMELIYKEKANYHTLEGLYECPDKTGGRLFLERKPPRV